MIKYLFGGNMQAEGEKQRSKTRGHYNGFKLSIRDQQWQHTAQHNAKEQ